MSSSQTKKRLNPREEENGRQRLMAVQRDDFDPQRVEKSRTAEYEEISAYVEGKKWRRKCVLFVPNRFVLTILLLHSCCRLHRKDWKRRCFRFGSGEVGSYQFPPLSTLNIYLLEFN